MSPGPAQYISHSYHPMARQPVCAESAGKHQTTNRYGNAIVNVKIPQGCENIASRNRQHTLFAKTSMIYVHTLNTRTSIVYWAVSWSDLFFHDKTRTADRNANLVWTAASNRLNRTQQTPNHKYALLRNALLPPIQLVVARIIVLWPSNTFTGYAVTYITDKASHVTSVSFTSCSVCGGPPGRNSSRQRTGEVFSRTAKVERFNLRTEWSKHISVKFCT